MRVRRRTASVALGLLAASVAATGLGMGAGRASAGVVPGSGWTASPVPPIVIVPMSAVRVAVSAPAWAFDRVGGGPSIPVGWRPTIPVPSGTSYLYDVEFRRGANIYELGWETDWASFVAATPQTSAALNLTTDSNVILQNADAVEWRARAVDPVTAEPGPWSASVVSNIPMDDNWHHQTWETGAGGDLAFGHSWISHAYAGDFYGAEHTTTAVTFVDGGLTPFHGPRLVIFGMKCPHCGKFTIDITGGRTGHTYVKPVTIDTYAATTEHRVVLCSLAVPDSVMGLFQIDTLATHGRPRVSIDAWGVSHAA
jgi:hypothetical protein